MKVKKLLVWIIVIIFVVGGGFLVYKYAFNSSKGGNSSNFPSNPEGKLSQAELEKYLLEKRLDLQKYFVFNLQEVKTDSEHKMNHDNERYLSSLLSNHLTKISHARGAKRRKEYIAFVKEKFENSVSFADEWRGEELDKKIKSGNCWIVFEKNKENNYRYFGYNKKNLKPGEEWNTFFLAINDPDLQVGSKSEILEVIKADPVLEGRI